MSLYSSTGNAGYDSLSSHGGPDPTGMMAGDVGMFNGLDMDVSLPMELDIDLSGAGDHGYASMPPNAGPVRNDTYSQQNEQQDINMAGAGPLPTGFGMPAAQNSSTLTEFTKRRNWSQRIIEELKDFLHILTPDGRILYVSPSCKHITGHEPHSLINKFIGEYVHPDDSGIFMREFNESIASGNRLRFFYRFKKDDGNYIIFECDGHPHLSHDPSASSGYVLTPNGQQIPATGVCRGFFMMARPYPTRNAALLDSFLEHKIENERLLKRVEELKREEAEENAEQDRLYRDQRASSQAGVSESQAGVSRIHGSSGSPAPTPNYQGMPPPAKPPISNTALTRQNLDSALSAQKPDSIADKMSRYEANNTHLESIELLTGLRYRDGERSHGISTGDTSPALIRGDAGIAILLDRDRDGSRKERKKAKVVDEYVCADCGTLDSPEWRKGPKGPKTLCNACGLRWAKKEKKRGGDDKNTSPTSHGGGGGMSAQLPLPSMTSNMAPGLPMGNSGGSGGSGTTM